MERLQKFMAHRGIASRRKSEELIQEGLVKVNGKVVTVLGFMVNPEKDKIQVNGKLLKEEPSKIYLMLNKPRGYISTVLDPKGRKTVKDLVKDVKERIYPIGRLDYDSEGLLLLTNDGDLTLALTHPSHQVKKTYRVRVKGIPSINKLNQLENGVPLEDGITYPAQVHFIDQLNGNALLEIVIKEGRNRQVKRMCEYIGHEVIRLRRTKLGELSLGELKVGEYRKLTQKEITTLKKYILKPNSNPKIKLK